MISIDEMNDMLNDIADEVPEPFYQGLNGGVVLSADIKFHDADAGGNLYVLGEYHRDINMGRYIVIYYGSFSRVCSGLTKEELRKRLKKTLLHEFTHHVESLAGERGLEYKDARLIADYRRKQNGNI